jgi:hypothetical protein
VALLTTPLVTTRQSDGNDTRRTSPNYWLSRVIDPLEISIGPNVPAWSEKHARYDAERCREYE